MKGSQGGGDKKWKGKKNRASERYILRAGGERAITRGIKSFCRSGSRSSPLPPAPFLSSYSILYFFLFLFFFRRTGCGACTFCFAPSFLDFWFRARVCSRGTIFQSSSKTRRERGDKRRVNRALQSYLAMKASGRLKVMKNTVLQDEEGDNSNFWRESRNVCCRLKEYEMYSENIMRKSFVAFI